MDKPSWPSLLVPEPENGEVFELFHENSKTVRHRPGLPDEEVRARMMETREGLRYRGYPTFPLAAEPAPLASSLAEAITSRESARALRPRRLALAELTALLRYSYGIRSDRTAEGFPRPCRVVPSGGALYPLDVYVHTSRVEGLPPGIFYYDPSASCLRHVVEGDRTREIARALVQPEVAMGASATFFVAAFFERATFKYGDRAYRFILLEAGHLAQNLNLVATALGLGVLNIGGYFDHEIDALLELDGLTRSTVYVIATGERVEERPRSGSQAEA